MGFDAEETIRADADGIRELSYEETKKGSVFNIPTDSRQQIETLHLSNRFIQPEIQSHLASQLFRPATLNVECSTIA